MNGKIVVCDRGVNARVEKSREVFEKGGVGMILLNPVGRTRLTRTFTSCRRCISDTRPSGGTHVRHDRTHADGDHREGHHVAVVVAGDGCILVPRARVAATGDQLKPDMTAPGVDVLAGYSPASVVVPGRSFEIVSGTSMSSPHVAGLGLLLKDAHPDWTPAMIKSALMTTADNVVGTFAGDTAASADARRAFAQGAGHVGSDACGRPGSRLRQRPGRLAPVHLRYGPAPGVRVCPVRRTDRPERPQPRLDRDRRPCGNADGRPDGEERREWIRDVRRDLRGLCRELPHGESRTNFTIGAGSTQNLDITFTRTTAPLNMYQAGFMVLTSGSHVVRSPIVIRPVALAAPLEVTLNGSNAASYDIKSGVGPENITLGKRGLIAASTDAVALLTTPTTRSTRRTRTATPPRRRSRSRLSCRRGQSVLRFSTHDVDTDGNDDLDVYLYRGTTLVAVGTGPTSEEVVTVRNPTAATYHAYVHAFEADGGSVNFTLFNWLLGAADAGNMAVNGPFAATHRYHAHGQCHDVGAYRWNPLPGPGDLHRLGFGSHRHAHDRQRQGFLGSTAIQQ